MTSGLSSGRIKLVIIDDDPDLTRYVTRLLESSCDVIAVHDSSAGIDVIRQFQPELVLLDVMMPGLDGFALLKAIRADQFIYTTSVMVISGQATEDARFIALAAGADDYLVKPFKGRELAARVHSHVQLVHLRRTAVEREAALAKEIDRTRQLRELYEMLKTVREEERAALAREVHDQLGQHLSAAKIDVKLLEHEIQRPDTQLCRTRIVSELQAAGRSIEQAMESVRRIATDLRPPELERHGLAAAIEWQVRDFERRTRIRCHVRIFSELRDARGAAAVALFRICMEALTNILRHSQATRAWVCLARRGKWTVLRICDDGVGISPAQARSADSIGLEGMRERAAILHGRLAIGQLRPRGTMVVARIPNDPTAVDA